MRRRGMGWLWVVGGLSLVAAARPAIACQACTPHMVCAWGASGANLCVGNGFSCFMAGPCLGSRGSIDPDAGMIQVTILDAPFAAPGGAPARKARGEGLAVGRRAARLGQAGAPGLEPEVIWSGFGEGEGVTGAFRTALGDGFTLRRDADGRGAWVTVRALVGGRPGPVLARERLGEDESLITRIPFQGRPRLLVIQAPTLPRFEADARGQRLARELDDPRLPRADGEPPFRLEAVGD